MGILPAHQVAHERRDAPASQRVAPPNADRARVVGSPPSPLERDVETAAAVILWLVAGGSVGVTLAGTFEENDVLGGAKVPPAPDRTDDEPGAAEEPSGKVRQPLPVWLVPPEPP